MVAQNEGRIGPILNADKALMCLNFLKGAAGEARDVGFEVRPEYVPLAFARDKASVLQVMNTSEGSSGVGVDDRAILRSTGRVLHGD
jgi:hypothetical protein